MAKLALMVLAVSWCSVQAMAADAQMGRFDADGIATRESDTTARLDVYVQIPYMQLSFIRDGAVYNARFEIMAQVRSGQDSIIRERTWIESIQEPNYETTIGRTGRFAFYQKVLSIGTGDFTMDVTLSDKNARLSHTESRRVHVPDYPHSAIALSGLLFASGIADMAGQRTITPIVGRDVSAQRQGVFVFFETYSRMPDTLDAVAVYRTGQSREAARSSRMPMKIEPGASRHFVKLHTELLSQGSYTLTLYLVSHVADTAAPADVDAALASMSHEFSVEWSTGVPQTDDDLEHALAQLRWVATGAEVEDIRSAPTLESRRDAYKRFWASLDPTPGTVRNEAQELYFSRIRYANEHFKGFGAEGYASDQGMIYVIFGEPSSIESHPFEYITYGMYHGPYTVWYFQRNSRSFVFIDQDGFNDFRLASPAPVERFRYGQ